MDAHQYCTMLNRVNSCPCAQSLGSYILPFTEASTGTMMTVLPLRCFWESHLISALELCHATTVWAFVCLRVKCPKKPRPKRKVPALCFCVHRAWSREQPLAAMVASVQLCSQMFSVNVRPYAPVDQRHPSGCSRNTLSLFNMTACKHWVCTLKSHALWGYEKQDGWISWDILMNENTEWRNDFVRTKAANVRVRML